MQILKSDLCHTTSKRYKNYFLEYRYSFLFYKNFFKSKKSPFSKSDLHNKITIINYGVVEDVAHTCQSIRNIILTMSHETPINASQIAACLRMVIPAPNFLSSQLAVTIWNPHQRSNTNTIKLNIESIQLIVLLITVSNVFPLSEPSFVPATPLIPTAF